MRRPYSLIFTSLLLGLGAGAATAQTSGHRVQQTVETGALGALPPGVREALGTIHPAYQVQSNGKGGWSGTNAAQGFQVHFDAGGASVSDTAESWKLGIELAAWGRAANTTDTVGVGPTLATGRMEYDHGGLVEWYQNLPRGLEQGFTLTSAPAGNGDLRFHVSVNGGATPFAADESTILFTGLCSAPSMRYAGLLAFDASGKELPATLGAEGSTIVISVDDRGAVYPVTVDPFLELNKLTASDAGSADGYGVAVDVDGDTMVIGASGDDDAAVNAGAVYVLGRDVGGLGNWGEVTKILAPDGLASDTFGNSVALSGDTLVAGAGKGGIGAAYVLERNLGGADNWGTAATLLSTAPAASNQFGFKVAIDGDTAVVSEPYEDTAIGNGGAAYIYDRDQGGAGTWGLVQKIFSGDPGINDVFGSDVAVSGDEVAVGSSFDDQYYINGGAIFLYGRDVGGADNWGQFKKAAGFYLSTGYLFGDSVALEGDILIGGAYAADATSANFTGSCFVLERDYQGTNVWGARKHIVASNWFGGMFFASYVDLDGDTLVVGAPNMNTGGAASGSAYTYGRHEGGTDNWGEISILNASDAEAGDEFSRVAVSGETIVVGAPLSDDVGGSSGSAYVFGMPVTGELALSVADCQDDADPSAGYQVAVELNMLNLTGEASGYAAFVDYDMATFAYRGDLSTYTGTPFALNISPINQADDGLLELDGSVGFSDPNATGDALLATLVFDVLVAAPCAPAAAMNFETGGAFASKLSLDGTEITTTLTDPGAYTLDDTDPVFDPFSNITQAADASLVDGCAGAVVTFTDPTATDNCSTPGVVSVPASGSFFATGTTQVTTTATDACGNSTDLLWDVTVTSTNVVHLEVELVGVDTPVTRCIRLQGSDCTFIDVSLSFTDHDVSALTPVRAVTSVEMPCGEYTSLCAKDQQHTKWSTTTLSIVGPDYDADALLSLDGGDTDDDGDVDIDDVTLFLAQFGTGPFPDVCAWTGVRDSDFSNNGAIAAEDYTFLVNNWLTLSSCVCSIPSTWGGPGGLGRDRKAVTTRLDSQADLYRDGWIDYRDVELFETRNNLPHTLSKRMRGR
jgi:hypothetical protein